MRTYYPILDRTIEHIRNTPIPFNRSDYQHAVMTTARNLLEGGELSRRLAEVHALRFLMCELEGRAEHERGA
ncbi:MAG: hypothetical protein KKH74_01785 [Gammaproteobacteria bacterium]|nr:hypothetical protein [Gammaproteobacteria bacterium]MBU1731026.1 hypothetical protein [Gammaproteobacteria bacterium]MBU1893686.1 hypothetical protein [Gammaproteobacteria bacterium]